ncbi:MAG: hypothetical protein NC302_07185 [Bacteroidales bacterium]|nr:hypothetical protein [Bacteroidales bacterium]MCM1415523.1 hypothetical protein [bacterium]MCM1423723.1 hypothetical protein [bacterium]
MIHKSRKWRIFLISILSIFAFSIFIVCLTVGLIWIKTLQEYTLYTTYCKDYYSVISNTERYDKYDQIIEVNGEPDKITREKVKDDDIVQLEYDDGTRVFVFGEDEDGHRSLCRMELTDPEYRFGRKKIGIGTDKSIIEKVYRNSYHGLIEGPYDEYYVEDGDCSVSFYFDENDKVCKMVVGDAEIYHGTIGWKKVKKAE